MPLPLGYSLGDRHPFRCKMPSYHHPYRWYKSCPFASRSGLATPVQQLPLRELPEETLLLFLLGSRYYEADRLSETAWKLFGEAPMGWGRVQAICDYVNRHNRRSPAR